jgi:hypothetical protein
MIWRSRAARRYKRSRSIPERLVSSAEFDRPLGYPWAASIIMSAEKERAYQRERRLALALTPESEKIFIPMPVQGRS